MASLLCVSGKVPLALAPMLSKKDKPLQLCLLSISKTLYHPARSRTDSESCGFMVFINALATFQLMVTLGKPGLPARLRVPRANHLRIFLTMPVELGARRRACRSRRRLR